MERGRRLRLAFFGTPEFAVPTLERLLQGDHPVSVVVTQPDRPRGRGRRPSPSPVATAADAAGVPVLKPERVADPPFAEELRGYAPDLGIVVAFGQFIPRRIRELPALGFCLNGHASLLPRHRGAAPIARAILAGDPETGISVMRVEKEMDAGPVAGVRRTNIGADENTGELTKRLSLLTADTIADAVEQAARGLLDFVDQDDAKATHAPKIERADARLDWSNGAEALVRRIRAMAPSPGATTTLAGNPLRILAARAEAGPGDDPGVVRRTGDRTAPLRIATGDGWLVPTTLQRAGGRPLPVAEFDRGQPLADGARLGG